MGKWKLVVLGLFVFSLFLSSKWIWDGNLLFNNDIARDFYLMKDIWDNKHLTLIGARAGGLTGWFHGPLWLYLNLPAYVLGGGNPVAVGWFWFGLHVLTCFFVFWTAKKIFDEKTAYVSLLIYSTITILSVHGYINPQGALILFPLFFYFYWKYKKTKSIANLVISLFIAGLMVQFQIAFGAPILILTIIDNILTTIKDKKISRFLAYLILVIPLSTYILFELRHDFLQLKSIANLGSIEEKFSLIEKIRSMPIFLYLALGLLMLKKKGLAINLFLFFYVGFWVISLGFKGKIMDYYYLPFLPVLVIVFVSIIFKLKKYFFIPIFFLVLIFNWNKAINDNLKYSTDVNKQDWTTWKSVKTAADWTVDNCGKEAGAFVYTADLYGYNLSYALNNRLALNQKKEITCLLMGPNVKENQYGSDNWKSGDVKISGQLIDSKNYENGIKIEKYKLEDKDMKISPNPFLIKDTFFR